MSKEKTSNQISLPLRSVIGKKLNYDLIFDDGETKVTLLKRAKAPYEISLIDEKKKLDDITSKYIGTEIFTEITKNFDKKIVIIDVPLLYETGIYMFCDMTIGVIAKKETCIERIIKRDKITRSSATSRINSQKKEEFFKEKCTYCIFNDDEANVDKQIEDIFNRKKFIE